jgi:cytochrome P450
VIFLSRQVLDYLGLYIDQCIQNNDNSFVTSYVKAVGMTKDQQEIKYLVRDLISAGSETTMTMICWALVHLANHPAWQTRLQEQVQSTSIVENA